MTNNEHKGFTQKTQIRKSHVQWIYRFTISEKVTKEKEKKRKQRNYNGINFNISIPLSKFKHLYIGENKSSLEKETKSRRIFETHLNVTTLPKPNLVKSHSIVATMEGYVPKMANYVVAMVGCNVMIKGYIACSFDFWTPSILHYENSGHQHNKLNVDTNLIK